jgi:hypothetical protein
LDVPHVPELSLNGAAITAIVSIAPGLKTSIAKRGNERAKGCLDVTHVPQLSLDGAAITARGRIALQHQSVQQTRHPMLGCTAR